MVVKARLLRYFLAARRKRDPVAKRFTLFERRIIFLLPSAIFLLPSTIRNDLTLFVRNIGDLGVTAALDDKKRRRSARFMCAHQVYLS